MKSRTSTSILSGDGLVNRGDAGSAAGVCSELRRQFPGKPIVIYSTAALPPEKEETLRAGAAKYLNTAEELLNIAGIASDLIAGNT